MLTLMMSVPSSLRSSIGPEFAVGDIGFLRRTVRTRDIVEFRTVNDIRATARLVNDRRLTFFWVHAGSYAHAWDEASVVEVHTRSMLEVARQRPAPGPKGSDRIVSISIIRWRLAFWVGLVAAAPIPFLIGSAPA